MELYTTSKPELQGAFPKKLDIVNDPDFKEAINAIFAMCTKIKKKREGAVVDRTSIVDQILKKKILHSTYRMSKNYKKVFADYAVFL